MTAPKRPRGRPPAVTPGAERMVMVRLTGAQYVDANRLAAADDRPLSTWIRRVVAERIEAERTLGSAITPPGPPTEPSGLADDACRTCAGSGLVDLPDDEDDGSCVECGGTGRSE